MNKSKKQDLTPSMQVNNEIGNTCYPYEPFAFSVVL